MARVLVDTHLILWVLLDDPRLPENLRGAMSSADHTWIVHQASIWEIQTKFDLGRLDLPAPPNEFLLTAIEEAGFARRSIEDEAIFLLGKLPPIHRDPFDRLLVAHALLNGWPLATVDRTILRYPVNAFR